MDERVAILAAALQRRGGVVDVDEPGAKARLRLVELARREQLLALVDRGLDPLARLERLSRSRIAQHVVRAAQAIGVVLVDRSLEVLGQLGGGRVGVAVEGDEQDCAAVGSQGRGRKKEDGDDGQCETQWHPFSGPFPRGRHGQPARVDEFTS